MELVVRGVLAPGESEFFDVALRANVTYSIYVEADEPTMDLDLYVYDGNGHLIDADENTDSDALCMVTPRRTGPFRLEVKYARGISGYRITVGD